MISETCHFGLVAKADKDLDFVIDYMKNRQRGGGVRRRRVVKKTTKKMSKKMSKKKKEVECNLP